MAYQMPLLVNSAPHPVLATLAAPNLFTSGARRRQNLPALACPGMPDEIKLAQTIA